MNLRVCIENLLQAEKLLQLVHDDLKNLDHFEESIYIHQRRSEITEFIEELGDLDND